MAADESVFDFKDYKDFLLALANSQARGLKKKMAELAQCQTAYVSHVLNGNAHFSWEQAEAISTGVGHGADEKEYFLLLVEFNRAGTPSLKKFLETKLEKLREAHLSIKSRIDVKETLSRENQAVYYSAWYYAAIHVMLTIPNLQTMDALAKYLHLNTHTVSETLDFLISVGLAIKSGSRYTAGTSRIHLERNSPLISKHHINWRLQAIRALEVGSDQNLNFSSVFTISEKDFQKLRSTLVKEIETVVSTIKSSKDELTASFNLDFFKV